MTETFLLFAYGSLRSRPAGGLLDGCERVGAGAVRGTLYDLGEFTAVLLSGDDPVPGTIWRCPADRLPELDDYEGTADGLFRRSAVSIDGQACWMYVAGPKLGPRLVPEARVAPREDQP